MAIESSTSVEAHSIVSNASLNLSKNYACNMLNIGRKVGANQPKKGGGGIKLNKYKPGKVGKEKKIR